MSQPIFEILEEKKEKSYSVLVITPLEQGYGFTLGNSLRRVLLTSLPGAAITSVKIAGVNHQFSSLSGMKEDVVEFCLNLKKVRVSYSGEKPTNATLKVTTAGNRSKTVVEVPVRPVIVQSKFVTELIVLTAGTTVRVRL